MSSRTIKLLTMFLIAAAFLNLLNYVFCWIYHPTTHRVQMKTYKVKLLQPDSIAASTRNINSVTTMISDLLSNVSKETAITKEILALREGSYYMYVDKKERNRRMCPEIPSGLGRITTDINEFLLPFVNLHGEMLPGGYNKIIHCKPRERAAIIVPFRGSRNKLITFLYFLHPILMKQQLEYQVFVIGQANASEAFNRGKLFNAAFTEIHRRYLDKDKFRCFILHEANLVPLNTRNLYRCSWQPRQLATTVQKRNDLVYGLNFGGAVALSHEQYIKVNGFSNLYWNSDADYEDMLRRLKAANYTIERTPLDIGSYSTLDVLKKIDKTIKFDDATTEIRSNLIRSSSPLHLVDGLTSLSYTVNEFELRGIYTNINVSLPHSPEDSVKLTMDKIWNRIQSIQDETTTIQKTTIID